MPRWKPKIKVACKTQLITLVMMLMIRTGKIMFWHWIYLVRTTFKLWNYIVVKTLEYLSFQSFLATNVKIQNASKSYKNRRRIYCHVSIQMPQNTSIFIKNLNIFKKMQDTELFLHLDSKLLQNFFRLTKVPLLELIQ